MSNLNKIKVVDYTMGRRSSDDVNTDIPFSDNFAKTRTIQQANVVLGAYVNRNYKDNRQWLTELENKADKDEIPEKTSDLTNDGSDGENPFITNQVNDLVNYTNNTDLNDIITPIITVLQNIKKEALQIKPVIDIDVNNMKENGIYWYNSNMSNIPDEQYGVLLVFASPSGASDDSWWITQIAISTQNSIFKRVSTDEGETWDSWHKYNGLDTGWIDMSSYINTDYFYARPDGIPMVRKIGNVVYWKGAVYCHTSPNVNSSLILQNIPSDFLAPFEVSGSGIHYNIGTPFKIYTFQTNIAVYEQNNIIATQNYEGFALGDIGPYLVD